MTDTHPGVGAPPRVDAFDVLSDFEDTSLAVQRLAAAARLHAAEQRRMADSFDADRADILRAWRVTNDVLGTVLHEVEMTLQRLAVRARMAARAVEHAQSN